MSVPTIKITTEEERRQGLDIRKEVFVQEQNVPVELEVDDKERIATHVLAFDPEGRPVATGRIRPYAEGVAKFERIAVLRSARTGGYGRAVMEKLEQLAREELGAKTFVLEAQVHAEKFYEKLGYVNVSPEPFEEAGIMHVRMEKQA